MGGQDTHKKAVVSCVSANDNLIYQLWLSNILLAVFLLTPDWLHPNTDMGAAMQTNPHGKYNVCTCLPFAIP